MTAPAVFVGEVATDEYYVAPRWPGVGDKATMTRRPPEVGGTMANAACCFASYGAPAALIYLLGDNAADDALRADLEASGVSAAHIGRGPGLPESKTIVVLTGAEHTILIPDRPFDVIELSDATYEVLAAAPFLYSTPADLRLLRRGEADGISIVSTARAAGSRVALDLDVGEVAADDEPYLRQADVVFVNDMGDARLEEEGFELRRHARTEGGPILVVTHAERGCSVFAGQDIYVVEGIDVEPVDVTGAGDAFGSSFMFALSHGAGARDAAEFANAAAARSVTVHGPRGGVASVAAVLEFANRWGRDLSFRG